MKEISGTKPIIHLIELPTYPKGILSLGIPAVSSALSDQFDVKVIDMNIQGVNCLEYRQDDFKNSFFIGLKVSSQNYSIAKSITTLIRENLPNIPIVWGGEYPTLLPVEAIKHADIVVSGAFEPIADMMITDLKNKVSGKIYDGRDTFNTKGLKVTNVNIMGNLDTYYQFMGVPVETSKGCDKKCTFCMVHTMQPTYENLELIKLEKELEIYNEKFVNVVDYNIGVNRQHFIDVAKLFEESKVLGWMAETCIESLDDDGLLQALSKSRCKMIYCGLESIDEDSLKSVNKSKTNQIENYERIIHKVQSYGIQVAAGVILGIEGTNKNTFKRTYEQFNEWGIIYTKLTFLTYNPGTKVKTSMLNKGTYLTEEIDKYDGNHLTFLAKGVNENVVYEGTKEFILRFYSFSSILQRSRISNLRGWNRMEFILFNLCYRNVYAEWLKNSIFNNEEAFYSLLIKPFKKSKKMNFFDRMLTYARKQTYRAQK